MSSDATPMSPRARQERSKDDRQVNWVSLLANVPNHPQPTAVLLLWHGAAMVLAGKIAASERTKSAVAIPDSASLVKRRREMTGLNRCRDRVLTLSILSALCLFGPRPLQAEPPKEPSRTSEKELAREPEIVQEIERIVRNIKVSLAEDGETGRLDLLEGPLLQHERPRMFVRGTVWAWGAPGRPQALLSLSLTGRTSDPQWCHEMVSLSMNLSKPLPVVIRGGLHSRRAGILHRFPMPQRWPRVQSNGSYR
jgi:hypothetical protein